MKKLGDILLTVFAIGVLLCLLAGGIALLGFVAALCIGGETATAICVFIHKEYFPWVIKFAAGSAGIGLVAMYLNKISALSLKEEKKEEA